MKSRVFGSIAAATVCTLGVLWSTAIVKAEDPAVEQPAKAAPKFVGDESIPFAKPSKPRRDEDSDEVPARIGTRTTAKKISAPDLPEPEAPSLPVAAVAPSPIRESIPQAVPNRVEEVKAVPRKRSKVEKPAAQPSAPDTVEPIRKQSFETEPVDAAVQPTGGVRAKPQVEIRQIIPDEIRQGQPIPVEISLLNTGRVSVDKLIVTSELPEGVEFVSGSPDPAKNLNTLIWSLGQLEPGQQRALRYKLLLKTAAADHIVRNSATVRYEVSVNSMARVLQPKLVVEAVGPTTAVVNEKTVFEVKITNQGNTPATNVVLRDALPSELSHPYGPDLENEIGRLGVGETKHITLTVMPVKAGKIVNRIDVAADGVPAIRKELPIRIDRIELALGAAAAKARYLHRPVDFQFSVSNNGVAEAQEGRVVAAIPRGVAFVHASDAGQYDPGLHQVSWAVGRMKPGDKKQFAMTGVATKLGEQVCKAVLTANGVRKETAVTTVVQGVAAVQMEVVDYEDPLAVGETTIYEIRIVNQGTAPQTNLKIACKLPSELAPLDSRGPTRHELHQDLLLFKPLERLEPKAEAVYKLKVKAKHAGEPRLHVELTSDQHTKPIVKEEPTTIYGDEN